MAYAIFALHSFCSSYLPNPNLKKNTLPVPADLGGHWCKEMETYLLWWQQWVFDSLHRIWAPSHFLTVTTGLNQGLFRWLDDHWLHCLQPSGHLTSHCKWYFRMPCFTKFFITSGDVKSAWTSDVLCPRSAALLIIALVQCHFSLQTHKHSNGSCLTTVSSSARHQFSPLALCSALCKLSIDSGCNMCSGDSCTGVNALPFIAWIINKKNHQLVHITTWTFTRPSPSPKASLQAFDRPHPPMLLLWHAVQQPAS